MKMSEPTDEVYNLCITDSILAECMAMASNEIRQQEAAATKRAIEARKEMEKYAQRYFDKYKEWPGGWDAIHDMEKEAASLAAQAEHVENITMIQQQWLNGGWSSETWKAEITEYLKNNEMKDIKDRDEYYDNMQNKRYWKDRGATVIKKMLKYIDLREFDLLDEKRLVKDLAKFGEQLRIGATPDPKGSSAEASATLVLFYQTQH